MQPEDDDMVNIETAMADANRAMCTRGLQSRVVDAALAARAAYHAQVSENELAPVPAELAIVIGRRVRNVTPAAAARYIFGYTAAQDISDRTIQKACPMACG